MTPDIDYETSGDGDDIRIRDIEQIEWVEWSRAQALDQRVQIESHFTDRECIHTREITEVDLEGIDGRDECVRQLTVAFGMIFDDGFVEEELVEKRGVIDELVDKARDEPIGRSTDRDGTLRSRDDRDRRE